MALKVKEKCLWGSLFGFLSDQIFHAPGAKLWHYAAELRTLSVTFPLCGLAVTNTADNLSEMCQLKLRDFCLFLCHQSYMILQGQLIHTMAFTSCHDRGSNLLPPDGGSQHSNHAATPTCFKRQDLAAATADLCQDGAM